MCARPSRHLYRGDALVSPEQGLELAVHVTGKSAGCPALPASGAGSFTLVQNKPDTEAIEKMVFCSDVEKPPEQTLCVLPARQQAGASLR